MLVWLIPGALVLMALVLLVVPVRHARTRHSPLPLPTSEERGGPLAKLLEQAKALVEALDLLDRRYEVRTELAAEAFARVQRWIAAHDQLPPDDRAFLAERGLELDRLRRLADWHDAAGHKRLPALVDEARVIATRLERLLGTPRAPYR